MEQSTGIIQKLGLLVVVIFTLHACSPNDYLVLDPASWDFGKIQVSEPIEKMIEVENTRKRAVQVVFTPTSPRLQVSPRVLDLEKYEKDMVSIQYQPPEKEGTEAMQIIAGVRNRNGEIVARYFFPVTGEVYAGTDRGRNGTKPWVFFEYVYDPGCKGCEIFLAREMIRLQQELDISLHVSRVSIQKPENFEAYMHVLEALEEKERAYPAVIFRGTVLQGYEEIKEEFEKVLRKHLKRHGNSRIP